MTYPSAGTPPPLTRIVETALYVEDVERSAAFYQRVLGLEPLAEGSRLVPMNAGGGTVLLLFRRGATEEGARVEGGWIPPHGSSGPSHFALAIRAEDVDRWRVHLDAEGVDLESEVRWGRGGVSLYLRDPDGHSVELATPGIWSTY